MVDVRGRKEGRLGGDKQKEGAILLIAGPCASQKGQRTRRTSPRPFNIWIPPDRYNCGLQSNHLSLADADAHSLAISRTYGSHCIAAHNIPP